ncbi:hypothetical protein DXG01_009604 [Tephrocybe rancida]|nr:hypothetical protein DXG01_009604 [Tephrocybe rancida]
MSSPISYAHTSSASSSKATASVQATQPADNRLTIVGIVLGIIGIILVAGVIFTTLRMKRRRSTDTTGDSESFVSPPPRRRIYRMHPAAHITPFGTPGGDSPRFKHTPGSDMRIAMRRPDGAWQFSDPRVPFAPAGVSDIDVLPSPSSYSGVLPPPHVQARDSDSKMLRDLHYAYDRHYDFDIDPPPPAYGYDYSGYIPPRKN